MEKLEQAPDKIYVQLPSRTWIGRLWMESKYPKPNATNIEYIHKDALLEWLEEAKSHTEKIINKTQSEVWEVANLGRLDIILSLIDKLNSM